MMMKKEEAKLIIIIDRQQLSMKNLSQLLDSSQLVRQAMLLKKIITKQ